VGELILNKTALVKFSHNLPFRERIDIFKLDGRCLS